MKTSNEIFNDIAAGCYDTVFERLYPKSTVSGCRSRYQNLLSAFIKDFGDAPAILLSAPGRTEVGGNHTDHQHGNVLAAAVDRDVICVAAPNGENVIRVQSAGYPLDEINLSDLSVHDNEKGKSAALIRGIAQWFSSGGATVRGFNACTTSDVLAGSGLSSSAAFEVVIGNAMARIFGHDKTAVEIAVAGQYAENKYFGKPCGLMDQTASSVGGFVRIDFNDPLEPVVRSITCDLASHGYNLCIVDTKGSHAGLTDEYAAITTEMREVSRQFGKEFLRDVNEDEFYRELPRIRGSAGDRAVLRAMHFFNDNRLAAESTDALESGDIDKFLKNIVQSGRSSFTCLQNIFSVKQPDNQGLSLALELSERLLDGKGAWRVHGGGFAGTIQAFVPTALLPEFREKQDALFGLGSCHVLSVRHVGGCEVKPDVKA